MHFCYPPLIRCDWGCRRGLGEGLREIWGVEPGSYVIACGRGSHYKPMITDLEAQLGPALTCFAEVLPEPELSRVDVLAAVLRDAKPDFLIGIGGGSVLDVAKAAALIAANGGATRDYFYRNRQPVTAGIPFIAMPTTAGTGSEMTMNSVLSDPDTRIKQSIRHPLMVPAAAICDAEWTVSLPAKVTVESGLDALTQAVEAYLTRKGNEFTRALAACAVKRILGSLETAVQQGRHREARTDMMAGSMMAGMSFSQSGLGAVHGLAHPIGALLQLPHGYLCAVLLPHILRVNQPVIGPQLDRLALVAGLENGEALLTRIGNLVAALGVPGSLAESGFGAKHFQRVLENCRSNSMSGNPRQLKDADILAILQKLSA